MQSLSQRQPFNLPPQQRRGKERCMLGRIKTDQKCPLCGSMFRDNHVDGLTCPNHPHQYASRFKLKFKKDGDEICRRYRSYADATNDLTGFRFKVNENTFDVRDYQTSNPLSFSHLADKYLEKNPNKVGYKQLKNIKNFLDRARAEWHDRNIKTIKYADIEDFLDKQKKFCDRGKAFEDQRNISDKTRHEINSCLHCFWTWLVKREEIKASEMPTFPSVAFELGWRNIVDKDTQEAILDEVYRISYHINPKIYIGIRWLATYIAIRPTELLSIKEKNIIVAGGYITVRDSKAMRREGKPKPIPMTDEDLEMLRSSSVRGLPDLPFFRHNAASAKRGGGRNAKAGDVFGKKYLYRWWKQACKNLGVEEVDLYGGTKHSSATALADDFSPEEIIKGTMHDTNKAFLRYCQTRPEHVKKLYESTRKRKGQPAQSMIPDP